ncbi:hypothetical protein M409DRAFT_29844 [Zasmidium cellare ATCC 36951]|uniref:NB-ARC domain-containing protein n=1 Tax=Zasmidium cellare ATCC 36951 TaxID=1080233 RepID=A0A6A6C1I7_ZASCE|nr:uncharacterized protein M409DRAFT_29844 [Zasmidium cellare ATCC 36951]KAF2159682.1 hypothetical protein M409DRAFT_29844 [Zasmidium cellare ATCC 36951]
MVKLRKEEYTVFWICALPIPEWQASRELFDVQHEDASLGSIVVSYQYVFGEINGHNVVMGCLPDAQPGVGSAASVATEMRAVFPSLRFGVLVGIGGAVPSKDHDIRLGDVVVSRINKDGRHGGVIHYDYGKYVQGGEFQETGMLNKPPIILSSALSKIRSAPPTSSKFYEYLESFQKCADYAPQFSSPPKLDQLFEATYDHPAKELTCSNCSIHKLVRRPERKEMTCSECSSQRIPQRPGRLRHPVHVHYGTIASGNQVIKDALRRDLIKKTHEDVLCFEMEAAGLIDHLQCIVIRGISDYCDSHKNKSWQPFASATAAAWAKELLRNIAPADVAKLDTVAETSQGAAPKTTIMLPYGRDKHFVGREAVFTELDHALADDSVHSRIGVVGLGGVGKSQVVTEYAYRLQQSQPNTSIFWVHASSRERFRNDYQSIATKLQLQGFDDLKADHLGIVFDWLQSPASGRWMMILDNADSKDLTASWHSALSTDNDFTIPTYLPRKAGSAVLVTSRDSQAAFDLVGDKERIIKLEAMTEDEAVQLFRTKTKLLEWDQVQAHRLSVQLDCIPLAITQAAAYIMARERMTIAAYLELFQHDEERLLSTSENDLRRDVNIPNAVIKTWEISFHQIQRIDEAAVELLFRMCFLSREGMPVSMLEKASSSRQQFDEALETLMRFSFVDAHSNEPELLKMHRLVQRATKTWIQIKHELSTWCFESLKLVWIKYPDDEFKDWEACKRLEPHAESVVESSLQHWLEAAQSITTPLPLEYSVSATRGNYDTPYSPMNALMMRAGLLLRRAKYAHRQARLTKAIDMAQRAKSDSESTFGHHHTHTLSIGSFLAVSYLHAGQLQRAERLSAEIVEVQRAIHGDEHPDTLITLCTLAMAHRELENLDKAEEILTSVIWMHECGLVTDEESLVMARNDLAIVYGDQGQWKKKQHLEQANLRILLARKGRQHPDTLGIQHNLAVSMLNLGLYKEAASLFQKVVEGKTQVYGKAYPGTLISMGHLANAYWCQDRQSEAYRLQQRILDQRQESNLAEDHPTVLRCMSDVALYYHNQGRLEDSHRLQQEAFVLHQRTLDDDACGKHIKQERQERFLVCQERLSTVLWGLNRCWEARSMLKSCLEKRDKIFGHDHPSTVQCREHLSKWVSQLEPEPDVWGAILRVRESLLAENQAARQEKEVSTKAHVWKAILRVRESLRRERQATVVLDASPPAMVLSSAENYIDADVDDVHEVPVPFELWEPDSEDETRDA